MRILQFVYALPPHIGGLEQIVEQFSSLFVAKGKGDILTITSSFSQDIFGNQQEKIVYKGRVIGCKRSGVSILFLPSLPLIFNYPLPKFWTREFWYILKYAKQFGADIVQIHMRFFLTSLLGWCLAKLWKLPIVLVEHSSHFVGVSSWFKRSLVYFFDLVCCWLMYRTCDVLVATSEVCREFMKKFTKKPITLIYRGLLSQDLAPQECVSLRAKFPGKILIGVVCRLVAWKNVQALVKACYALSPDMLDRVQFVIVGGGEEYDSLVSLDIEKRIYFTGLVSFQKAIDYQSQFDVYVHTSSRGGALAGTLLQAMILGNFIVATPYEGAKELILSHDAGILLADDSVEKIVSGLTCAVSLYDKNNNWQENNKKFVLEHFDWDVQLERFVCIYDRLKLEC